MNKIIIASDFDGTITTKDSLFEFFEKYAKPEWLVVEKQWEDKIINSKECLEKEFALVPNLSEELIENYIQTIEVDPHFQEFYQKLVSKNIDFVIISDGVDYFINKICEKAGIKGVKIFSNHGEFIGNKFKLSYPNEFKDCEKNSGTCKCKVLYDLKKSHEKTYYLGDGTSDYCVSNKADKVFGKEKLYKYCLNNNIECTKFQTFEDLIKIIWNVL